MMYSVSGYADMIADSVRVDAYGRALRSVITPQSFVVEIGTGIGVFAVIARQMGARRVVAIEPSDAIAVARMLARENGQSDIEFVQALSRDVTLSEPADVVFSDLRGVLPPFNGHFKSIVDARERLLAPGGVLIPMADTLYAAVVEAPDSYAERVPPSVSAGDVTLDALRPFMTNNWTKAHFKPERLLTTPAIWAMIDYRTIVHPHVQGSAGLTVNRPGIAHGLAVWFDATLVDGVSFSNAPGQPRLIYGSAFFPWPNPVDLHEGDRVCVRLEARHVADDYVWCWHAEVWPDGMTTPAHRFHQSTFQGQPVVPANLRRGDAAQTARLNQDGHIERFILQSIDGLTTNQAIARNLMHEFPARFPQFNDALGRVGLVARRFGLD
jgi:type I protein arginine methyltransferase